MYFKVENELKQKLDDKERDWMQRVNDMTKQHRADLGKVHFYQINFNSLNSLCFHSLIAFYVGLIVTVLLGKLCSSHFHEPFALSVLALNTY